HTLDDEVQTLLLNLLHGDVYKLGRIDPETPEAEAFIPRVKPFREIPEEEIAFYAYLTGVKFQSYVCPYAPQALRSDIREFLNRLEARHPGVKFTLYHSFEKLKSLVRGQIKPSITSCARCGEPSSRSLCEACLLLEELEKSRVKNGLKADK
ncbi:MAG: TIGR00269 family protein, partial [Candidatus Hecatellales archaeon]